MHLQCAPAVKQRVDRMLDNGVIRGFTTVVDRSALGSSTEAYAQVFRHGTIAPERLRDMRYLEEALERIRSAADVERSERSSCSRTSSTAIAADSAIGRGGGQIAVGIV